MEPFRISNSKLHDWEEMCPIAFKAKHIDKTVIFQASEMMNWGNYFETLAIGGGINGAFDINHPDNEKMTRSVFKERVEIQAKECKKYLKLFGGKPESLQEYIYAEVTDSQGTVILIEGTLDIRYLMPSRRQAVIDLKLTGDTENDFGKFSWGSPEKMDLSQNIQYPLLTMVKYKLDYIPEAFYWVFDTGKDLKKKLISVNVSEGALANHIERLSAAYQEITLAILMDDWTPKNTWDNCSKCTLECRHRRVMPEIYEIEL